MNIIHFAVLIFCVSLVLGVGLLYLLVTRIPALHLYLKKEQKGKVSYVYRYVPVWMVFMIILVASVLLDMFFLEQDWWLLVWVWVFDLALFVKVLALWRPNKEIRAAMAKGKVTISGEKFSFKNPITYTISKGKE